MTNFTIEMNYNELKAKAKELGMVNPTGKSKVDLVNFINTQIEGGIQMVEAVTQTEVVENETVTEVATEVEAPKAEKAPKKTLADYGFEVGEVIQITGFFAAGKGTILTDRKAQLTKVSRAEGRVKGKLIDKNGNLQNTEINIPIDAIVKIETETNGQVEEVTEGVAV